MSLTNYAESKLLRHLLGIESFTMPSAVYASLHSADPGETGGSEVSGGSYARKVVAWDTESGGAVANSADLSWTNMPAVTVMGVALWDALSGGNCLAAGLLSSSKVVASGDTFKIAAGDLDATID